MLKALQLHPLQVPSPGPLRDLTSLLFNPTLSRTPLMMASFWMKNTGIVGEVDMPGMLKDSGIERRKRCPILVLNAVHQVNLLHKSPTCNQLTTAKHTTVAIQAHSTTANVKLAI